MLITDDEAQMLLEKAIEKAGGTAALGRVVGVSQPVVSSMRKRSTRRTAITGKIAAHLGLKRVSAYELSENAQDPKQEHYENTRREWAALNGIPYEQSKTMRVAGAGTTGQRFPDRTAETVDTVAPYKR